MMIVVNVILLIIEINNAEWFFLSAFVLEILLKLYVYGGKEFFTHYWNMYVSNEQSKR
jgi:two pore calcium channel protein 3